jgi:FdhD protein
MDGVVPWRYTRWEAGESKAVDGALVDEHWVHIHVNGLELATIMASPVHLDWLALGFLRSEGLIDGLQDVRLVEVCPNKACVDVWLHKADFTPPTRAIVTSGCGGGLTFDDLSRRVPPVEAGMRLAPQQINDSMRQLLAAAMLYKLSRGVHTSALSDGHQLTAVAEDVGRHNTIDKLWGFCLSQDLDPAGHMLVATGRISSEMINKAAKMRLPVVVSRTSPTGLSVRLAQEWNITLVGYARGNSFNVYAGEWRLT